MDDQGEEHRYPVPVRLDHEPNDPNSVQSLTEGFKRFVKEFRSAAGASDDQEFLYRSELRFNIHHRKYHLVLNVEDLKKFNNTLYSELCGNPNRTIPLFEEAMMQLATDLSLFGVNEPAHPIQLIPRWLTEPTKIRHMKSGEFMAKLLVVDGIITSCSAPKPHSIQTMIKCQDCGDERKLETGGGMASRLPTACLGSAGAVGKKCRNNPYSLQPRLCTYSDYQYLKLQELPEDVPTGEMPRRIRVQYDRDLVDKVKPGMRVSVVAIYTLQQAKASVEGRKAAGVRHSFLRAVGIWRKEIDSNEGQSDIVSNRPEQDLIFQQMAKDTHLYEKIARSIDPAVWGMEDVKKAIACQLFGGTRKTLAGGGFLRGDINILLVGDPSTAKSQLLKFVHKTAPISVYTSGKGSSAAGLTATVVRDREGDFYLEGGAMVLGDGGVVCIDEFDKMNPQDRSAIHEAMEQQTISIAKAGITTVLNSRASVLAASNPRHGSYDESQDAEEQLDFQQTVLSRFDVIFKVLDPKDPERDEALASYVVEQHKSYHPSNNAARQRQSMGPAKQSQQPDIYDMDTLKNYIRYCKSKCHPQLSPDAANLLTNLFVQQKKDILSLEGPRKHGLNRGKGRITIRLRQLEAIVRISEALAKMRLATHATQADVTEAWRLFKVSTVDMIQTGLSEAAEGGEIGEEVRKVEHQIRRMLVNGTSASLEKLRRQLMNQDFAPFVIDRALMVMRKRDEVEFRNQRRTITRK
eukprot:TRINITY_DN14335_c0_g1_i1.p1 TRINITY_DN14335_c0_g1~~TRINITY_DN14335_c0_g1_i1.p1  ORF type:complete len:758 (-),score=78.97 TRINITY_DN14335_c0_g1_i1:100-2337(-)